MKLSNITKYAKMSFVTLMSVSLVGIMGIFPATADAVATLQTIGSVAQVGPYGIIVDESRDRAIVANWNDASVVIVDMTDVKNPTITSRFSDTLLHTANDVEIDATGSYAYVTTLATGLVVVDLNTGIITRVGSFSNAGGIDRDGSMIYVAAGSSVESFDISNPATPIPVASYAFDAAGPLAGIVGAWDLKVSNGMAYVATFNRDSLYVIDVTNTAGGIVNSPNFCVGNPGDSCLWAFNGALGIAIDQSGDYAYVLSYGEGNPPSNSTNIKNDYGALSVIDITTPTSPVIVAEFTKDVIPAVNGAWDLAIDGDKMAVTSMNTGLVSRFDISDPLNPKDIVTNDENNSGTDIAFYGNTLINLSRSARSIDVLDMIDDSNPSGGSSASGGSAIRGLLANRAKARSGARQRVDGGLLCPVNLNVSLGSVNEDVMRVKSIVAFTGDFSGSVDNDVYDQATADAVLKFQQKRNLKLQDGIVGIETQGAMAPICRGEETGATTPVVDLSA